MMIRRRTYGRSKPDSNTVLLLHFDDNVLDSSGKNVQITGVPSYTDGVFGKAGSFRYKEIIKFSIPELSLNSGYTIEFWLRKTSSQSNGFAICSRLGGTSNFKISASADGISISGAGISNGYVAIENSIYYHVAVCVTPSSRYAKIFVDGVLRHNDQNSPGTVFTVGTEFEVGYTSNNIYCDIDELRISDIARYTSDFTPPTKPF